MSVVVVDTTNYACYPQLATFQLLQQLLLEYVASVVDANTVVTEEGLECLLTNTDLNNLYTTMLQVWGLQSMSLPINRAIYPVPSTFGIIVDT